MIDLRSDTVTRPTGAMRAAMAKAEVGDDVFRDDPSVIALEKRMALLLGKEAALFVPSGTMANQLALRMHTRHGDEVIAHRKCHIFNHESGAAAALAGVQLRLLDSVDGSLPECAVEAAIRSDDDPHNAPTTLIAMENTHNECGGVVVPQSNIQRIAEIARQHSLRFHLDGARLFNASVASGLTPKELAAPFDSVSVCFSKGLGAPIGSVVSGTYQAVATAYRFRKMYGGGMRQAGVLAQAAMYALDNHVERLVEDHRRAQVLAIALSEFPRVQVDLATVQTNLVYFRLEKSDSLNHVGEDGVARLVSELQKKSVYITGGGGVYRAVTHLDIDDQQLHEAIRQFEAVLTGVL
ncbi:MAG: low-specificity L-threonine aldolase [Myxococcales bacterium]|nr:low-specificity L-threonine aldolase [Myxococcales bacterium]